MAPVPADLVRPDLRQRFISGGIVLAIAVVAVAVGGWLLLLLLIPVVVQMVREWCRLVVPEAGRFKIAMHAVAPVVATLMLGWIVLRGEAGVPSVVCLFLGMLGLSFVLAVIFGRGERNWWSIMVAAVYLGTPVLSLLWLRDGEGGLLAVLWLCLVVACTDTFAYLVGSTVGGPKLAPSISPGKTRSGLLGGMAAAAVAGGGAAGMIGLTFLGAALLAGFLAVVAQCGDLLESWLKRRAGVKDSGTLIPGHGGLLDRLDGFLLATPALVIVLILKGGA